VGWGFGVQVLEEAVEGQLVGVVVLPVAEIGDEIFARFSVGGRSLSYPSDGFSKPSFS